MNPYLDSHQERCLLQGVTSPKADLDSKDDSSVIYFTMDFKNKLQVIDRIKLKHGLKINVIKNDD